MTTFQRGNLKFYYFFRGFELKYYGWMHTVNGHATNLEPGAEPQWAGVGGRSAPVPKINIRAVV